MLSGKIAIITGDSSEMVVRLRIFFQPPELGLSLTLVEQNR